MVHFPNTMSRANAPSVRPLSLTEELEKLEQSITLTLQGTYTRLLSKRSWFLMTTQKSITISVAHTVSSLQVSFQLLSNMQNIQKQYGKGQRFVCASLAENNSN